MSDYEGEQANEQSGGRAAGIICRFSAGLHPSSSPHPNNIYTEHDLSIAPPRDICPIPSDPTYSLRCDIRLRCIILIIKSSADNINQSIKSLRHRLPPIWSNYQNEK